MRPRSGCYAVAGQGNIAIEEAHPVLDGERPQICAPPSLHFAGGLLDGYQGQTLGGGAIAHRRHSDTAVRAFSL